MMSTKTGANVLKSILVLLIITIYSCGNSFKKEREKLSDFKNDISKAQRFTIEKADGYTILKIINPWQGAEKVTLIYNLIRRGAELPTGMDSASVIFVPVKKIICMSTTHIAMISALGEENTIAGVSGSGFIFSENLIGNIKKGLVEDVGYDANLNKELILKISPDLIMMYGIGNESDGYVGKIRELGIKVVFNADYLETDPLSRAEWIKLFGALYCKEELAESIYTSESAAYNELKSYISKNTSTKPKVLLGLPFKDTWYISPGNSFISTMITDAGGEYLWKNTESSISMPLGLENVYLRALTADFWLNMGTVKIKEEISAVDQRLNALPCFKSGNLYNNNKRITLNGGNDYWEMGSVYPHLILKDIASILHPGLFSDHELFYYRKIN